MVHIAVLSTCMTELQYVNWCFFLLITLKCFGTGSTLFHSYKAMLLCQIIKTYENYNASSDFTALSVRNLYKLIWFNYHINSHEILAGFYLRRELLHVSGPLDWTYVRYSDL